MRVNVDKVIYFYCTIFIGRNLICNCFCIQIPFVIHTFRLLYYYPRNQFKTTFQSYIMKQFACETINLCAYLDEKLNFNSKHNLKLISFQPFCGWSKQRNNLNAVMLSNDKFTYTAHIHFLS